MTSDTIPLLHNDDAFHVTVEVLSAALVRITKIVRYPHNRNVDGTLERFFDLDEETKRAVIKQVNRRYVGRTVKV